MRTHLKFTSANRIEAMYELKLNEVQFLRLRAAFQTDCLYGCVQTGATTPNIVAPTMLGVVACVLAVVYKRM